MPTMNPAFYHILWICTFVLAFIGTCFSIALWRKGRKKKPDKEYHIIVKDGKLNKENMELVKKHFRQIHNNIERVRPK